MRLDRFLSKTLRVSNKQVKTWLEGGEIALEGQPCTSGAARVTEFSQIQVQGRLLPRKRAHYFVMNKPAGVLSATRDPNHTTALDLLGAHYPEQDLSDLHLAGRLDRATTGLLLLTNDGAWSKGLTLPERKIPKTYLVTTERPIDPGAVDRFAQGVWFDKEGVTTAPARLSLLDANRARLTIFEGMHHQVKRMFALYQNPVVALHRESMGVLTLGPELTEGACRPLTQAEVETLRNSVAAE